MNRIKCKHSRYFNLAKIGLYLKVNEFLASESPIKIKQISFQYFIVSFFLVCLAITLSLLHMRTHSSTPS